MPGYGPFHPGFSPINDGDRESPKWAETYLPVKGVPTHWQQTQICRIWLNTHQFVYQNMLAGKISSTDYVGLQKGWHWVPDTTKLSKRPIKCYLYIVKGFDPKTGKYPVMVDTNNNLNFGDEKLIYPPDINPKDPYQYDRPLRIHYEVYQKGSVHQLELPMVLKHYGGELFYNFPQHAMVSFEKSSKQHRLLVSSGFTSPDFEVTSLVDPSGSFLTKKVAPKDEIQRGDVIEINQVRYRNKGVDVFNNWLELEPVHSLEKSTLLQVGYPIQPFKAQAFGTSEVIDLTKCRGRYVYLDFWATWCKGCVAAMPALMKIYQQTNRKRVEFIGIAQDSPERLTKFLARKPLAWPQIIADSTNNLTKTYHVVGLPTSVLIDPNGIVIGRNLLPDELQAALKKIE